MREQRRTTVYFSVDNFKALRLKAIATNRSISELVDDAVKASLAEDAVDFDAFTLLRDESVTTFDSFVSGLRRRGAL